MVLKRSLTSFRRLLETTPRIQKVIGWERGVQPISDGNQNDQLAMGCIRPSKPKPEIGFHDPKHDYSGEFVRRLLR